ncbi:kynurenine formamidase-like [Mytilus galloprovincialis]|uniref:kynurenine formamidase-like n=1 Tax=Mytilus galloprovincialis TaxID=29158 RepID=UPI003F7C8BEE
MNNEELEKQYSPSKWTHRCSPDEVVKQHIMVLAQGSEKAKAEIECQLDRIYGDTEKQKLDIFGADTLPGDAPIFVYIHGGYWQALGREISSFMVGPICKAGAVVVAIGYDLAPKVSMSEIVNQCKKGVSFVLNLASHRGSSGVYIGGHSAGGHLAAMMLSVDWMTESMQSNSMIKGALLVSGIYDLQPLVNTYVNDPLKMTQETAWDNSPLKQLDTIKKTSSHRHIIVAVGQHDSPEFRRQSQEFQQKLKDGGLSSQYVDVPNTDHFNVIENLQSEDYELTKELLKMMKLNISDVVDDMAKTSCS